MPKRTDINKILIIGAGPIVIGQACEFDYSGAQACKSLKDEGYEIILINSNPATIMTITADIQSLRDAQKLDLGTSIDNVSYQGATLTSDEAINLIKTYLLSNFCGDYLSINDIWGHDFDQTSNIWTLVKKNNNSTMSWILNDKTLEIVSSQGLC